VAQEVGPEFKSQYHQKVKRNYRAGGMAQTVECLPSKCKALKSPLSITKKKKEKSKHFSRAVREGVSEGVTLV
jgi:hypothetical protein